MPQGFVSGHLFTKSGEVERKQTTVHVFWAVIVLPIIVRALLVLVEQ